MFLDRFFTLNCLQLVSNHESKYFSSYGRRNHKKVTFWPKNQYLGYIIHILGGGMTHQNVHRDLIFHIIEFKIDSDTKNE